MPSREGVTSGGLRARRRRETSDRIQQTALALVSEHGLDHVTVEQISTQAGVSVRTFFNYFPSKESALADGPPPIPDHARAAFLAGTGDVLADLTTLFVAHGIEFEARRSTMECFHQVLRDNPRLMPLQLQRFHQFELDVAELIGARLGLDDDEDDTARLAAAVVLAAVRVGMERWSRDFDVSPAAEVGRALANLRSLWTSLVA
ncbi:AcrR family transcriptional regulator [Actinoalloteichus hoggarensis]|uniref:Transcriptional regulator, TetR family n=1 Tax=Actinoalloteichus hoggarensis TaxID=1470176 RepID=A0A221W378_9PSEU|nr:TetR family transcriptional regulator [Actinoalloteichus hoggarensis]ASO20292.1 Transcriptional regulator, TetR family [Actinoalloteichus hoggarensis]MBB5918994.1 AcrR family transcriptional regulator [Actinoalloteichus hoggarensis]